MYKIEEGKIVKVDDSSDLKAVRKLLKKVKISKSFENITKEAHGGQEGYYPNAEKGSDKINDFVDGLLKGGFKEEKSKSSQRSAGISQMSYYKKNNVTIGIDWSAYTGYMAITDITIN